MDVDEVLLETESAFDDAVSALKSKLSKIRTGRANPSLVEGISVEVYGTHVPLKQLAQVGIPEARLIVIKAFDPNTIKDIEKALLASNIGITPQSDGQFIRLSVPGLTQERRNKIAGEVKDIGEQIKVSLRNRRRDSNKELDKAEKEEGLPEDAKYKAQDEIQELLKKYEKTVSDLVDKKIEEVKTV